MVWFNQLLMFLNSILILFQVFTGIPTLFTSTAKYHMQELYLLNFFLFLLLSFTLLFLFLDFLLYYPAKTRYFMSHRWECLFLNQCKVSIRYCDELEPGKMYAEDPRWIPQLKEKSDSIRLIDMMELFH